MADRTVLVTGANGNLGAAVVKYFLDQGDKVIGVVHRRTESPLYHPHYIESVVDLLNEDETNAFFDRIAEEHTHVDIAVMTAGGFAMGDIEKTMMKDIQHQFNLNFATAYNLTRPLFINMKEHHGGKIFFIGSGAGMDTSTGKGVMAYALSKSQLFQLSNIINADTKHTGVQSYVVVPSIIDTPQNRAAMPHADFSKWEQPRSIAALIGKYATQPSKVDHVIVVKKELGLD